MTNRSKKTIELLAPAGSFDSLKAAIHAGADAVYIGGSRFGARAYANNLTDDEMKEAIDYVHLHGRKIYLTVNTLLKKAELENQLFSWLLPFYEHGIDAVIVQDLGVAAFIRKYFADLPVHASTQMTVTDSGGAALLEDMGVERAVLARELDLEEIRDIRNNTGIEIECFVHGALCYSFSGQCLFSSLIGGRSGNRGRCAQTCRLPFDVYGVAVNRRKTAKNSEAAKKMQKLNASNEQYVLSLKDIAALEMLPALVQAGVTSFKIEGRMKSPSYTGGVVRIYRKYLDQILDGKKDKLKISDSDMAELLDLYNRGGFHHGYFQQQNGRDMVTLRQPNHTGMAIGKVVSIKDRNGEKGRKILIIKVSAQIKKGDVLELPILKKGTDLKEWKKRGSYTCPQNVHPGQMLEVPVFGKMACESGQSIYRTRNEDLIKRLENSYLFEKCQEKINGNLKLSKEKPVILEVQFDDILVTEQGEIVSKAQKQPLSQETVGAQIKKTGNTPFLFERLIIDMEDDVFLPVSSLNNLRRNALESLQRKIIERYRRKPAVKAGTASGNCEEEGIRNIAVSDGYNPDKKQKTEINVQIPHIDYLDGILRIEGIDSIYIDTSLYAGMTSFEELIPAADKIKSNGKTCIFVMPSIWRKDIRQSFEQQMDKLYKCSIDGFLIRNLGQFQFLKDKKVKAKFILDFNIYTFQREAQDFWKNKNIWYDTVPVELNYEEMAKRGCSRSELVVYGYLPMMVSAQCVQKTVSGCKKNPAALYLSDRYQKKFRVENNCKYGYNTIYNCEPLFLYEEKEKIKKLNPHSIRLQFTDENVEWAKNAVESFIKYYKYDQKMPLSLESYTKGHFNRGIL